ncbi:MAG: hypothetical protein Q4E41_06805 [Bacteroidales bacterium]|nr:hypothetical protein [Bacteroidales bacterium]
MNNEETKVLNQETIPTPPPFVPQQKAEEEKSTTTHNSNAKRGVAAVVGAAIGTGAALGGEQLYNHLTEEAPVDAAEENANSTSHDPQPQEAAQEAKQEIKAEEVATQNEEPKQTEESVQNTHGKGSGINDDDIQIVGVKVVDNGQGGEAVIAGIENTNGDQALIVDIEADGKMDILVQDINHDGQISDDEISDISDMNISTEKVARTYLAQNPEVAKHSDYYTTTDEAEVVDTTDEAEYINVVNEPQYAEAPDAAMEDYYINTMDEPANDIIDGGDDVVYDI